MASDRVEAVERALKILNSFSTERPVLSLKQLAEETGFYKSTILRLTASLERFNYLYRQSNGSFRIGSAPLQLVESYRSGFDIEAVIRPILTGLRDRFNESVALYIKSGNQRICLYRANAKRSIRHQLEEGHRLPLDYGAAGRILLAYSGATGEPYDTIRLQGWYASFGERDEELAAVGVPILSDNGEVRAALCISGLIFRFDDDCCPRYAAALRQKAVELNHQLGDYQFC